MNTPSCDCDYCGETATGRCLETGVPACADCIHYGLKKMLNNSMGITKCDCCEQWTTELKTLQSDGRTACPKCVFNEKLYIYTEFAKKVVAKMTVEDRQEFEEDLCMNSLERHAEALGIPKPCSNPLPDVCPCCST